MMYHRTHGDSGFTMEGATATDKMGPFTPLTTGPGDAGSQSILPLGKKGSWDSQIMASQSPAWNGTHWVMLYIGSSSGGSYDVGYCLAEKLVGPWTQMTPKTPTISYKEATKPGSNQWEKQSDGFYTGGLQYGPHTNNEYWLYAETVSGNDDYGPMALWTSKNPEGPYTREGYTLIPGGEDKTADVKCEKDAWDCGGYSESGVKYSNASKLFYTAMAGVDFKGPHMASHRRNAVRATSGKGWVNKKTGQPVPNGDYEEHIGFAFSPDGKTWTRNKNNKIGPCSEGTPTTQAYAESHIHLPKAGSTEEGAFWVYHTHRFAGPKSGTEMLGIDIFVNQARMSTFKTSYNLWYNRTVSSGSESKCVFDAPDYAAIRADPKLAKSSKYPPQGGIFCPPVKATLTPKTAPGVVAVPVGGDDGAVSPTLAFAFTASTGTPDGSLDATLNVYESTKGLEHSKSDKKHTFKLSGPCTSQPCTLTTPAQTFPGAKWLFVTVTAGSTGLENAGVAVTYTFPSI